MGSYFLCMGALTLFFQLIFMATAKGPGCASLFQHHSYFYRLEPHVQELTSLRPTQNGPNCHNAVALWAGWTRQQRLVKWRELQKWIQKHQWRKLQPNEAPQWGDIVLFRFGPEDAILHSAIHLSANLYWQKDGTSSSQPWRIVSAREAHQGYEGLLVEHYRSPNDFKIDN